MERRRAAAVELKRRRKQKAINGVRFDKRMRRPDVQMEPHMDFSVKWEPLDSDDHGWIVFSKKIKST